MALSRSVELIRNSAWWMNWVATVMNQTMIPAQAPTTAARATSQTSSARTRARRRCGACTTMLPIGRR